MSEGLDADRPGPPTDAAQWMRLVGNSVNLSNAFGLAVARLGGCRVRPGPRGLVLADGYRLPFPVGGAFTIGNVVITAGEWDALRVARPTLLRHEEGHTWQWLACGGLPFLAGYGVLTAWSWLRTGDRAAANFFERQAGLEIGGYVDLPVRPWRETRRAVAAEIGRWRRRRGW